MKNNDAPEPASELARKLAETLKSIAQKEPGWDTSHKIKVDQVCKPNCEICGGIGFVSLGKPVGDPDFGKIQPCPNIKPWNLLGSTSGLTENESRLDWQNLLITTNDTKIAKTKAESLIKRGYGWLTLYGEYGTAKTHILKIITAQILQDRKQAVYVRMSSLLDDLRAAYDDKHPNEQSIAKLDYYSEVYCLAIDELDRINPTPWASERRFALLDRRYEIAIRRQGITLFAMNKEPQSLEGYLADRILDGRFETVKFANASLRPGLSWEDHQRIYEEAYEPGEHKNE